MPRLSLVTVLCCLGLIPAFGSGCGALAVPEEPPRSTPAHPLWSADEVREHLRFFNGPDVNGRATGSAGYATAAAYVAARMAEFGLQPVLRSEFRMTYHTPLNEIGAATLGTAGPDTLAFYPGVDFLPDGRSDSGRVQLPNAVIDPPDFAEAGAMDALPARAVLLPAERATTAYLQRLRAAGARAVFAVGALEPRPAAAPVEGLLVAQLAPHAATLLMQGAPADDTLPGQAGPARRPFRRPVRLRVEGRAHPLAGALNVMGYVPGKHPALSRELILVCADLDAVGPFAGVPTLEPAYLGAGAAALLETARQYAFFAQYTQVPERTLLFAVFSGARQGYAGLRDYLRAPLWTLDHTRAVVYVGLDPPDEPAVRALLDAYGLPLHVVSQPAEALPRTVLLPERRPPRQPTLRPPDPADPRAAPPRLADLIEGGVTDALRMAEDLHRLLLREAAGQAPLPPADAERLRRPVGN